MKIIDRNKSINEIMGREAKYPEFKSGLTINVYNSEKKPIKDLTNEELRLLLGQNFDLEIIVPEVLEKIRTDIQARSENTSKMLFSQLLEIEPAFWKSNLDLKEEIMALIKENELGLENPGAIEDVDIEWYKERDLPELKILIERFKKS